MAPKQSVHPDGLAVGTEIMFVCFFTVQSGLSFLMEGKDFPGVINIVME